MKKFLIKAREISMAGAGLGKFVKEVDFLKCSLLTDIKQNGSTNKAGVSVFCHKNTEQALFLQGWK